MGQKRSICWQNRLHCPYMCIRDRYTVGENQTIEEITAKYLFQTLQIEKIELGEAVSGLLHIIMMNCQRPVTSMAALSGI